MLGTVLKSISVSNYGPFADKVVFTTVADTSKKEMLEENTFAIQDERFNKVSYIYGSNGAGKSNFCKALLQIQNTIRLSPIFSSNNPQLMDISPFRENNTDFQFKFSKQYINEPTWFCIVIQADSTTYSYSFSMKDKKILSEKLTKKHRRTETILDRTSPDYSSIRLKSELSSFKNNISVVKENALCLSMAAFLNNKLASELVDTINRIKVVNMAAIRGLQHITEDTCTKEQLMRYLKVLKIADPTLKDIDVSFAEKKVERQKMNVPDLEDREFVVRSVQVDVESTHNVYDGEQIVGSTKLPFLQIESNGTIKLFSVLPVIFEALQNGSTVVIDEIENGLHPLIVKQIVNLFYNTESNPQNAQLICTTHSEMLIDKNVRRDQVWIVSKDHSGKSSIGRVSDTPGMRAYENNGRKYLEDAFGEVPNMVL